MTASRCVRLALWLIVVAVPATASEPQRRCAAIKTQAAGRHYQCRATESGKAAPNLGRCDAQLDRKFASAERRAAGQCPNTGDGAVILQASAAAADPLAAVLAGNAALAARFVDNGDGTVSDTRTGLMWEKLSDDGGIHDQDTTYSWADAMAVKIAALNSATFAGHGDWRLPNINELRTIVPIRTHQQEEGFSPLAFHRDCAPGCTILTCSCTSEGYASALWTSTTYHPAPADAWGIETFSSTAQAYPKSSFPGRVRAVRGGS